MFRVYLFTCVRVYLCTCVRVYFSTCVCELREHPGEEDAEESRPEHGTGEERDGEEEARGPRLTANPKSRREQGRGHREDGTPRLPREGDEGRVYGEEKSEEKRGPRLDLFAKEKRDEDEGCPCQRGPETGEEVETAKNEKQNRGEIGVRDVGTERGASPFDDAQGVQREPRLGIGQWEFAEAHEAQSEGEEEGEQI